MSMDPTSFCTLENQYLIEEKYNRFNLKPCLEELVKDLNLTKFNRDLVVYMLICKRATPATVVGVLRHHYESIQDVADGITRAIQQGLIGWDGERLVTLINTTPELQAELDLYQFPLPMIVEPRVIKNNRESGYYTHQSSIFLKNNHHDEDAYVQHLNRCNAIPLSVNMEVANKVGNVWKGMNETADKRRAFLKFDTSTRTIMESLFEVGNRFYLTHKYDKRGRTYCVGYHISYQGNDWQKAVIEFADKEVVV